MARTPKNKDAAALTEEALVTETLVAETPANANPPEEPVAKINWRERIKPEFIVVNRDRKDRLEKSFGKPIDEIPTDQIGDEHKLILLGGFKEVAQEKGYSRVDYFFVSDRDDYVTIKCTIDWNDGVTTSGCGNANIGNVESFWRNLLVTCAENRAFVRCVRNYLGIHIAGKDEVDEEAHKKAPPKALGISPLELLVTKLQEKGRTFEQFREWYSKINEGAAKWNNYGDIPSGELYEILSRLKSAGVKKEETVV